MRPPDRLAIGEGQGVSNERGWTHGADAIACVATRLQAGEGLASEGQAKPGGVAVLEHGVKVVFEGHESKARRFEAGDPASHV